MFGPDDFVTGSPNDAAQVSLDSNAFFGKTFLFNTSIPSGLVQYFYSMQGVNYSGNGGALIGANKEVPPMQLTAYANAKCATSTSYTVTLLAIVPNTTYTTVGTITGVCSTSYHAGTPSDPTPSTTIDLTSYSGRNFGFQVSSASNDAKVEFVGLGVPVANGNIPGGTLGSVPYQTGPGATGLTAPNTSSSTLCYTETGTGSVGAAPIWGSCAGSAATAFSALTSSTNTSAAMVVGSGASLDFTGTGTIDANLANGAVLPASAGFTSTNSSRQLVAAAYTPANCTAGTTGSDCLQLTSGLVPVGNIPTAIPIANIGSAGLSGTAPVSIASTGAISMHVADASDNGYLSSTDWSTFNGKQAALSLIKGTYVDGDLCAYTASGTLLNCNVTPGGTVTSVATTGPITGGTITSSGTIACATCVVATVNPSAGLLRVAGSTQTATGAELSGDATTSGSNAVTVAGLKGVPFCTGFTPTNGQLVQYTTGGSPNPCYTSATPGLGGDTISSPNSTLAVGGTVTATTLDLQGSAGEIMAGATPALTYTPTLGKSGTAGTLALFPASGNFTTTLGSAATASNTILFPATVPGTLDGVHCVTSSTTCTLTDNGYAYNAIPNADLANSAITIAGTSVSLGGSTSSLPSPGAIGGGTPSTAAFTTITGTSSTTLGTNGGTGGSVVLNGSTSGSATINTSATGVLALPSGTTATRWL